MPHYKVAAPAAITARRSKAEPAPAPVPPITHTYATTRGLYNPGQGMTAPPARAGAAAASAVPSRMNDRCIHRDGRVTDLAGNPVTPTRRQA